MKDMRVSVIIAARNEESSIGDIIREAKRHALEILVIDGHSEDSTRPAAEEEGARVFLDDASGSKGAAIRLGIKMAVGDIIVLMDGDGSHDARDIPKLIAPIKETDEADMVIASRIMGGSDERNRDMDERMRFLGSAIITKAVNIRWRQRLTDVQNGFKAIRAGLAKSLDLREGVSVDQETVMKVLKSGYRVKEIPSHEYARRYGTSKVILRKVWFKFVYSLAKNII